jgi:hypothetical protein
MSIWFMPNTGIPCSVDNTQGCLDPDHLTPAITRNVTMQSQHFMCYHNMRCNLCLPFVSQQEGLSGRSTSAMSCCRTYIHVYCTMLRLQGSMLLCRIRLAGRFHGIKTSKHWALHSATSLPTLNVWVPFDCRIPGFTTWSPRKRPSQWTKDDQGRRMTP